MLTLRVRVGLELARRVVRDAREVDHRVDRREERAIEAADVGAADPEPLAEALLRARKGVAEVQTVEDRHPVALLEQQRHENRADITGPAGDEHVHGSDRRITKRGPKTSSRPRDPRSSPGGRGSLDGSSVAGRVERQCRSVRASRRGRGRKTDPARLARLRRRPRPRPRLTLRHIFSTSWAAPTKKRRREERRASSASLFSSSVELSKRGEEVTER